MSRNFQLNGSLTDRTNMDYLKLAVIALSPIIALSTIVFGYKKKVQTGDVNKTKEVLTGAGWTAMGLVVVAGLFSIFSEWGNQRKTQAGQAAETARVIERLDRLEKSQEALTEVTNKVLLRVDEGLALSKQKSRKDPPDLESRPPEAQPELE